MTPDTSLIEQAHQENERLAERLGVRALSLRVSAATELTPSCRRIRVDGPDLLGLDPVPGQDLMLALDAEHGRIRRRRYTIRRFDPQAPALDIDVALHGDGPGVRWARSAVAGDTLEALGPRGQVTLDTEAAWHLFLGDDSFAPAALAMAEAVGPEGTVILALQIDGPGHEQPATISARELGPRWVYRGDEPLGSPVPVLGALGALTLPGGRGHAYVGGEHTMVLKLRQALIDQGLPADAINAKAYWRLGRQNALHGEPDRD